MKSFFLSLTLFAAIHGGAIAQSNTQGLELLEISLFNEKVFKSIFFEYDSASSPYDGVKPSGKCAFILPDSVFRTVFPKIFRRIDGSGAAELMVQTTRLVQNPKGTLFASANLMDVEIETWIRFDKFDIDENSATLVFHTTHYSGGTPSNYFKYYRIECFLEKKGVTWKTRKLKMKQIGCCDDRKEFSRAVARVPGIWGD